jgi:GntR family histidine utilization transcriptional repressor
MRKWPSAAMCTPRASCWWRRKRRGADLAQSLGLRTGDKVFHTVLVHLENGVPIQYEDRYVNPAAAPDYLDLDFTQTTPTHHLLACAPLTEASYSIEACLPTAQEAKNWASSAPSPAWP